jgi:hypothetical protein
MSRNIIFAYVTCIPLLQVLISGYIFQQTTSLQHICNKLKLTENLCIRQRASVMIAAGGDTVWVGDKTATTIHMNKTQFTGQTFFIT